LVLFADQELGVGRRIRARADERILSEIGSRTVGYQIMDSDTVVCDSMWLRNRNHNTQGFYGDAAMPLESSDFWVKLYVNDAASN